MAVGSSRADRGARRRADSAAHLQAVAVGAGRYAVAGDDVDRVPGTGDSAVSAQAGRPVAVDPRILGRCRRHHRVREIPRRRRHRLHLRRNALEAAGNAVVQEAL